MTGKADFTAEEWETILEGPTSAGLLVIASDRGGSIRESFSMAKVYAEARAHHGDSDLLDAIVSEKPELDHGRLHSLGELHERSRQAIRDAVALVERKATAEELEEYTQFVANLAENVANARREGFMGLHGERVSEPEKAALAAIAEALATTSA